MRKMEVDMKKLFLSAVIVALFGNFLVLAYYVNANRNNPAKVVFLEREYFAAEKVLHVYQETVKGWELYAEATNVVQRTYEAQLADMRMTADKYLLLERVLYLQPRHRRGAGRFTSRLRAAQRLRESCAQVGEENHASDVMKNTWFYILYLVFWLGVLLLVVYWM